MKDVWPYSIFCKSSIRWKVNELAKRFGISEMTVRRDLNLLARQYNITRTHGGALMANQPVVRMISFDESRISNREAKEKDSGKSCHAD